MSGVGRAKLEDLGEAFLDCINSYAKEHGVPEIAGNEQTTPGEPRPRVVGQSFRETGKLISEGVSLEEVAEARGLAVTTVMGHLERLVESGVSVEWEHLLPSSPQLRGHRVGFLMPQEVICCGPCGKSWVGSSATRSFGWCGWRGGIRLSRGPGRQKRGRDQTPGR